MNKNGPLIILIVEDSTTDVMLMREALEHGELIKALHVVNNGVEAIEFLHQRGKYSAAPRPDLILLDLNMPRKNGQEVLAEIKAAEHLKMLPVVILTTSQSENDVRKAYRNHANCYITKPVDFEAFADVMRSIANFWCSVVTLPPA